MREFAKGYHRPEFIETCEKIVDTGCCGGQEIQCINCPGSSYHNNDTCFANGWENNITNNAQAYLDKHKPKTLLETLQTDFAPVPDVETERLKDINKELLEMLEKARGILYHLEPWHTFIDVIDDIDETIKKAKGE